MNLNIQLRHVVVYMTTIKTTFDLTIMDDMDTQSHKHGNKVKLSIITASLCLLNCKACKK